MDGGCPFSGSPPVRGVLSVTGPSSEAMRRREGQYARACAGSGGETAPIGAGRLRQNNADESFNGKLREEGPVLEWFGRGEEARVVIEAWPRHSTPCASEPRGSGTD